MVKIEKYINSIKSDKNVMNKMEIFAKRAVSMLKYLNLTWPVDINNKDFCSRAVPTEEDIINQIFEHLGHCLKNENSWVASGVCVMVTDDFLESPEYYYDFVLGLDIDIMAAIST